MSGDSLCQSSSSPTDSDLDAEEEHLAMQLKDFCDKKGKEIDVKQSALILHKLGKVYHKRGPDMFSLIRSATLYNAAIVRCPTNLAEVQNDLERLCKYVLREAQASNKDVDLIKKSKHVKQAVTEMRNKTEKRLMEIELIPDNVDRDRLKVLEMVKIGAIKKLQNDITSDYSDIMADVASYCEHVMGEPSCKFALAGMGSLARKEITPFSDFENIILLENSASNMKNFNRIVDYFKWFSVIFQIVLINIQETIIPSVAIYSLNDKSSKHGDWFYDAFTTRGVSFDGMMPHACKFPLGRQQRTKQKPWKTELIKTVEEMLKYLTSEQSLKNGYHLSDILTKTCFVYKDKDVYDEFEKGVFEIHENNYTKQQRVLQEVKSQVTNDLEKFATRSILSTLQTKPILNIKQVIYRSTTLFISALGRICHLRASSCFEIVASLAETGEISRSARHKLLYAVAVACEIRLRWYHLNKKQCDELIKDSINQRRTLTETLLGIVGKNSTISYFQIAYALQCEITKRLDLKKTYVYSDPKFLNLSIGQCFSDRQTVKKFFDFLGKLSLDKEHVFNFDENLKHLEGDIAFSADNLPLADDDIYDAFENNIVEKVENELFNLGYYDDAQEYCKNFLAISKQKNFHHIHYRIDWCAKYATDEASMHHSIAMNLKWSHKLAEAKEYFRKTTDILQKLILQNSSDALPAYLFSKLGSCFLELNKSDEVLVYFEHFLRTTEEPHEIIDEQLRIGWHIFWQSKNDAIDFYENSLHIISNASLDLSVEIEARATFLYEIGVCLRFMNKSREALDYFERSLEQRKSLLLDNLDKKSDEEIAKTYSEIGNCLIDMDKPDEAIDCFEKSLQVHDRYVATSEDVNDDKKLAETLHRFGFQLVNVGKIKKAIAYFEESIQIRERISPDADPDLEIAQALCEIGTSLHFYYIFILHQRKSNEPVTYILRSLQIIERVSLDGKDQKKINDTLSQIVLFLLWRPDSNDRNDLLRRLLFMKERILSNVKSDADTAKLLFSFGHCLSGLNQPEEAITYFQRSLQIQEHASSDKSTDEEVAEVLFEIGKCLVDINKLEKAIEFFKRTVEIKEQTSLDLNTDKKIAKLLFKIGSYLSEIEKPNEAIEYFKRSLDIRKFASSDVTSDKKIANVLFGIGECLKRTKKPKEATDYFKASLQILERESVDVSTDDEIAELLFEIGDCLVLNNKKDEAFDYFGRSQQIKKAISSIWILPKKLLNADLMCLPPTWLVGACPPEYF